MIYVLRRKFNAMFIKKKTIIVLGFSPKEYDLANHEFMAHLTVQSMGSIL